MRTSEYLRALNVYDFKCRVISVIILMANHEFNDF